MSGQTPGPPPAPPRGSSTLLRWVLSEGVVGRSILGDLAEEYALRAERDGARSARRWYRRAALGIALRRTGARWSEDRSWTARDRSGTPPPSHRGDSMIARWILEFSRAIRGLARTPGFLIVTAVTLGLAIGANATIFSVVDGVLLDPLPYDQPDQLVSIRSSTPGNNTPPDYAVSPEFYVAYGQDAASLQSVAIYTNTGGTLQVGEAPAERVQVAQVSRSFFETLGVTLAAGRLPVPDDLVPTAFGNGQAEVVLISHELWSQGYGADPQVMGAGLTLDGSARTVIGVLPADMDLPGQASVWVPFEIDPDIVQPGQFTWEMIGRVAPGVSTDDLEEQLGPIADRIPEQVGQRSGTNVGTYVSFLVDGQYRPVVRSLEEEVLGDISQPLLILLGTAAFVLLIACANVANLFMVRAESRQREMAVRAAMGASRAALVRTYLVEALVISAVGGALACLFAWIGVPLLVRAAPNAIPRLHEVGLDLSVLAFAGMLSIVAALIFGTAAAVGYSGPLLLSRLRQGGRGSIGSRDRSFGRNALVVSQSGLALVLLVGSGLLVRSFAELMDLDPGFDTNDILSFQVSLPADRYETPSQIASFHLQLRERLASLPGVESVGMVGNLMLDEGMQGTAIAFEEVDATSDLPSIVYWTYAGPGFFESMGIDVLAGRSFVEDDHVGSLGNVVVSRRIAEERWPGQDAIGKRLRTLGDTAGWDVVVGVVEDVRSRTLREEPEGVVYFPLVSRQGDEGSSVPSPAYTIRAKNPEMLASATRNEVAQLDPSLPVYAMQTMESVVSESVVRLSFTMLALGIAAVMAVILGAIGLYGVLSYLVAQRTREIGVRLALGARAKQVRRLVVGQGARLVSIGLALGLIAAAILTRVLQGLLFGTEPLDPVIFVGMGSLMLLVGLLASYVPAVRASRVSPLESMREE